MVHRLQNEIKKLTIELIKARDQQDDHIRHLRTLEKALEKMERQKGQQQAAQVRSAIGVPAGPTLTAPLPKCLRPHAQTEMLGWMQKLHVPVVYPAELFLELRPPAFTKQL